jgi:hypothetical protein
MQTDKGDLCSPCTPSQRLKRLGQSWGTPPIVLALSFRDKKLYPYAMQRSSAPSMHYECSLLHNRVFLAVFHKSTAESRSEFGTPLPSVGEATLGRPNPGLIDPGGNPRVADRGLGEHFSCPPPRHCSVVFVYLSTFAGHQWFDPESKVQRHWFR